VLSQELLTKQIKDTELAKLSMDEALANVKALNSLKETDLFKKVILDLFMGSTVDKLSEIEAISYSNSGAELKDKIEALAFRLKAKRELIEFLGAENIPSELDKVYLQKKHYYETLVKNT